MDVIRRTERECECADVAYIQGLQYCYCQLPNLQAAPAKTGGNYAPGD